MPNGHRIALPPGQPLNFALGQQLGQNILGGFQVGAGVAQRRQQLQLQQQAALGAPQRAQAESGQRLALERFRQEQQNIRAGESRKVQREQIAAGRGREARDPLAQAFIRSQAGQIRRREERDILGKTIKSIQRPRSFDEFISGFPEEARPGVRKRLLQSFAPRPTDTDEETRRRNLEAQRQLREQQQAPSAGVEDRIRQISSDPQTMQQIFSRFRQFFVGTPEEKRRIIEQLRKDQTLSQSQKHNIGLLLRQFQQR